uniref:Uncharacterized protein n=1 Tax=Hyaloperonospora arabidopsidis (strain Emoy2) TaxID=559515 RepID=M4B2X9_HYAAE
MVSAACPIDSKDYSVHPSSMLHNFSLASHESKSRSLQRCTSGLSHGLQMDLQQAVRLEKQELERMGLLPRPIDVETALATMIPSDDDEDNEVQVSSSPPYWFYHQQQTAVSLIRGQYGDCPPCSPPVPIPQHHQGLHDDLPYGIDVDQLEVLGTSQCEGQLCDKFWNHSLSSVESRESSQATTGRSSRKKLRAEASGDACPLDKTAEMGQLEHNKLQPMSSAACLVGEEEDEDDGDGDDSRGLDEDEHVDCYGDVFEMEDL